MDALKLLSIIPIVALLLDYGRMLWMRRKLPPGPFPFPLVGNHFQTPTVKPWITWEKWAHHYEWPMMTLWIGRHPVIIISDAWVASDLMEKKSEIFSSRPHLVVMGDAINATTTNQTTLPYGDRWRLHRKLMHMAVGSQAVRNYRPFQAAESKILTKDILIKPDDFELSIERYSVSSTSVVGWGRRIDRNNDYVAQQALKLMEGVNLVVPGAYIMEAIPQLMHLPSWLYKLPKTLRTGSAVLNRYFYLLTQEGAQAQEDNFGKKVLNSQQKHGLTDLEVSSLMGNLIGGGVDTTSSTMISCILALACFPEVQKKAQAEMDAAVGRDRSPNWADIDEGRIPYLVALVKEVLRWRTVTVLAGIPHANTKDVEYNGYHFPAGTNFTANMWAIHRNPTDFPNPDEFRPERFLNGLERPYPNARGSNPFGFGRRQCSGQPFAEQGLLFSLARLIWAFDIQPGLDENVYAPRTAQGQSINTDTLYEQGKEVKLDIFAYTESENTRPEAFRARFTPRSESIHRLILEEASKAREELRIYDGETKVKMEDAINNPAMK